MPKQKLTLSIDKEIISQAKSQNINLSSFLEIRLIDYLSDKEKCSRRDSNPSSWLESTASKSSMQHALHVLDTYILRRKISGISKDWLAHIRYVLENYLESMEWQIDETKTLHYLEQLKDKYSISSYRKWVLQIRKFLIENNINWADKIKIPKEPIGLPKRVTLNDIHNTLSFFENHPNKLQMQTLVMLGATSGMRAEEIYQLTCKDFDFDNNLVKIQYDPDNGRTVKNARARISFYNDEAKRLLLNYLDYFNNGCDLTFLFGQSHIQRAFNNAPIRVKDLRKFFSQHWDRKGGPTSIKKILLGHSLKGDLDRKHYNYQSQDDLKRIYDRIMNWPIN
jgi:integrase/recombinase XerD